MRSIVLPFIVMALVAAVACAATTVPITGTVTRPARVTVSPSPIAFGPTVGGTSTTTTVTLTNSGGLTWAGTVRILDPCRVFQLNTVVTQLLPGESKPLTITFAPAVADSGQTFTCQLQVQP